METSSCNYSTLQFSHQSTMASHLEVKVYKVNTLELRMGISSQTVSEF